MTFQEFVCTGRKRAIHPVTWRAFLRSVKANTLNFEFLADQFVQIDAASDHIAPRQSRRAVMNLQRAAKFIENFQRKESDLAFVIVFKIEIAIAAKPAPGHTFELGHFDHGIRIRLPPVMPDKIVSRRNVKMTDFHCTHDNIWAVRFT